MSEAKPVKIVIDAMGSEMGTSVEVEGAIQAVKEYGYHIVLVGDEKVIKSELDKRGGSFNKISVVHAPEKIEMHSVWAVLRW